eukprot:GILJ01001177.1.p1 GENE.GILJ01001177.1~~GILJ01001177.1.p1  ORF type:complete len:274 (+),score=18.13 GILJ01001177.1:87-908(+)
MSLGSCSCRGNKRCDFCFASQNAVKHPEDMESLILCCKCSRLCPPFSKEDTSQDACNHAVSEHMLRGFHVIDNFISSEEEKTLVQAMDEAGWVDAQSGRRKQDYGPMINYRNRKLKLDTFNGLPSYLLPLSRRLQTVEGLEHYVIAQQQTLDYSNERDSFLLAHVDDGWLWGQHILGINLLSHTTLSFIQPELNLLVSVTIPARSLYIMSGESRYNWAHAVLPKHIAARRICITLRELGEGVSVDQPEVAAEIVRIAATFQGTPRPTSSAQTA